MVRRAAGHVGDALRPHGVHGQRLGTFIGIIALSKMIVALTGGKTTLAKTLGALYVLGNIWTIKVFLPMNDLMEAHGTAWPSIIQSKAP